MFFFYVSKWTSINNGRGLPSIYHLSVFFLGRKMGNPISRTLSFWVCLLLLLLFRPLFILYKLCILFDFGDNKEHLVIVMYGIVGGPFMGSKDRWCIKHRYRMVLNPWNFKHKQPGNDAVSCVHTFRHVIHKIICFI